MKDYSLYLEYIQNTGGNPKISHFDEDWEPIGPLLRKEMKNKHLIYEENGKIKESNHEQD